MVCLNGLRHHLSECDPFSRFSQWKFPGLPLKEVLLPLKILAEYGKIKNK